MPHLRSYSQYYFWYFAALGVFTPYFAVWATHHGLTALQLAWLASLLRVTNVVSPLVWGPRAMHSERPGRWLFTGTLLAAVSVAMLGRTHDLVLLGGIIVVFGMFFHAVLPQAESMTLNALADQRSQYGRIRLWGSIGALTSTFAAGVLLIQVDAGWFPIVCAVLLTAASLAASVHLRDRPPETEHALEGEPAAWQALVRRPAVVWLLGVAALMNLGFSAYYVFFALLMEQHGHSGFVIGALLALATACEIWAFQRMPWFFQRWTPQALIALSLAMTCGRWLLLGMASDNVWIVVLSQAGHAFSFGVFHASCMRLMGESFPGKQGGFGMGLLNSIGFGFGGAMGALILGLLWQQAGPSVTFLVASGVTATALFWTLARSDKDRSDSQTPTEPWDPADDEPSLPVA